MVGVTTPAVAAGFPVGSLQCSHQLSSRPARRIGKALKVGAKRLNNLWGDFHFYFAPPLFLSSPPLPPSSFLSPSLDGFAAGSATCSSSSLSEERRVGKEG